MSFCIKDCITGERRCYLFPQQQTPADSRLSVPETLLAVKLRVAGLEIESTWS